MKAPGKIFEGYVFDLDGTVYLGDELLPGAKETLAELKRLSRVVYLTNKPLQMPADYAAKLTRLGVETSPEEVVASTDALLLYLERHASDARLFVIGEPPLIRLLSLAGYEVVQEAEGVDVVVVSFDRTFDYRKLKVAFDTVRGGARIVATNPDAYCPTPDGGLPDCAAMLVAVEASTGVPARETLLVGDRLATDVRMANEAGMASTLVLTGATSLGEALNSGDRPDYMINGLAELLPGTSEPRRAAQASDSKDG